MAKKENIKLIYAITLVLFMMSIAFIIIALNIDSFISLQTKTIPAKVTIGNHRGIDADPEVLGFGNVTFESFATRNISIGNSFDFPVQYEFSVKGNISEFLVFPEVVYLDVGETKTVSFSTIFITNEPKGHYSGKVIIRIKKVV